MSYKTLLNSEVLRDISITNISKDSGINRIIRELLHIARNGDTQATVWLNTIEIRKSDSLVKELQELGYQVEANDYGDRLLIKW